MTPFEGASGPPVILVFVEHEWSGPSLDSILSPGGYAVLQARSSAQTREMARAGRPDAIIIEGSMTGDAHIRLCEQLRSDPRVGVTVPIIVTVAEVGGRASRILAFAAGAWLFCSHPIDAEAFLAQLRTLVSAKRTADRWRNDVLRDEETGLYSLQGLTQRARELGADAQRRHAALSCVALSVSRSGEGPDDRVDGSHEEVGRLARVLRQAGRTSDAIGRLGPAEFGLIAPATGSSAAESLVKRFESMVASPPADLPAGRLRLTAGFSAADDFAESPVDAVEMLFRAARALRHARQTGRFVQAFETLGGEA